ncbi:uncharacterized protein LOC107459476 [Arachis duranensis]|uniref:Uncharacterized protein LOC107459476 n=1 Tax=Arachis duranensis TaxID=130453 RepID=A0A6P4BNT0_ARADU|nr:uncharacterized protein LOC107459476 [Arachis duranensis]
MIILAWNIRGVANAATIRTLKEIRKQKKPDIVLLFETRCSENKAQEVIKSIGFQFYIVEEAMGFSGGIWVLWDNPHFKIWPIELYYQYIHLELANTGARKWTLTAVYASLQERNRKEFFDKIQKYADEIQDPWMLMGDFNEIAEVGEKKGGTRIDDHACQKFREWINNCKLIDLGFVGSKYTWKGGQRKGLDRVFKRLDRALANAEWRTEFGDARVEILSRVHSDHHPLLAVLRPNQIDRGEKPFCFEAMWATHPEFSEFIQRSWNQNNHFYQNLKTLTQKLKVWNKEIFGHILKKKRRILNRLEGIQRNDAYGRNSFLQRLEKELLADLEEILNQEEIMWMQKSRQQFFVDGE